MSPNGRNNITKSARSQNTVKESFSKGVSTPLLLILPRSTSPRVTSTSIMAIQSERTSESASNH